MPKIGKTGPSVPAKKQPPPDRKPVPAKTPPRKTKPAAPPPTPPPPAGPDYLFLGMAAALADLADKTGYYPEDLLSLDGGKEAVREAGIDLAQVTPGIAREAHKMYRDRVEAMLWRTDGRPLMLTEGRDDPLHPLLLEWLRKRRPTSQSLLEYDAKWSEAVRRQHERQLKMAEAPPPDNNGGPAPPRATKPARPVGGGGARIGAVGVGAFIRDLLLKGKPHEVILDAVHKQFPQSRAKLSDVNWNLAKLRKEGKV